VAHRDIKLENVLVDTASMTLKVADFGYAAHGNTDSLKSYRGTFTYMAPEIKEGGKLYDGKKADLFSAGVVLFILVRGIFPFKEARKEEYFYSLLCQGKFSEYWSKVESEYLSSDFKNLIERMLAYDPKQRPSLEEIRAHPWMTCESQPAPALLKQQLVQQVAQAQQYEREAKLKQAAQAQALKQRQATTATTSHKRVTSSSL